ncbi:MAG: general secretion pathway protein GspK [Burkholderiales bacterium]|nr:general secretion pathway protein GspK [Burkholderiales bacterium]
MPHSQNGIALIIVLWITTLLMLIASSFIYAMRTDVNIVTNSLARARLEAAADAAVQRGIFEMFKPPQLPGRWTTDGVAQSWRFQGVSVDVSMTDESGKIDINTAAGELLRGLFLAQGIKEDEAAAITDAIGDWRDQDSLKRLRGAEEAEYLAAGYSYKPANALFQSNEELRLVMGMTPELFDKVAPLITIYSRQPGINASIAARGALRALPGATDILVDQYVAQREQARAAKLPIPQFAPALNLSSFAGGIVIVRAVASGGAGNEGSSFVREAVVMRLATPARPYTFLRWKEGAIATVGGIPSNGQPGAVPVQQ